MKGYLIKLKDGLILDIKDDWNVEIDRCPTCGLDEEYISDISFKIQSNNGKVEWFNFRSSDFESFVMSIADIIKIFISNIESFENMSIEDFEQWVKDNIFKEYHILKKYDSINY